MGIGGRSAQPTERVPLRALLLGAPLRSALRSCGLSERCPLSEELQQTASFRGPTFSETQSGWSAVCFGLADRGIPDRCCSFHMGFPDVSSVYCGLLNSAVDGPVLEAICDGPSGPAG